MKRYYVGAKHIGAAVGVGQDSATQRQTIEQAIADAKSTIMNGEADCLVVVKIVAIVQRDSPPIRVKYVKNSKKD